MDSLKIKTFALVIAALFLTTASGFSADKEDPKSIPYQAFHAMLKVGTPGTNGVDTNCTFVVASSLPDVSPSDIVFTIRSTNQPYEVHLDDAGYPIDFPLTPELLAENPSVFVNQPAGTVSITAWTAFTAPTNGPISQAVHSWVSEIVHDGLRLQDNAVSYQALHHLLQRPPTFRATVAGHKQAEKPALQVDLEDVRANPVVLEYKGSEAAGIRYHAANEGMDIPADANGLVSLPVSDSLWEANPWITFYPEIANWHAHGDVPEFATLSLPEILRQSARRFTSGQPAESGKGN